MPPVPLLGPAALLPGTSPAPCRGQSRVGLAPQPLHGRGTLPETAPSPYLLPKRQLCPLLGCTCALWTPQDTQKALPTSPGGTLHPALRHRDGGHLPVQSSLDL